MGCHFLLQGIGIELGSPAFQADALPSEPPGKLALNPDTKGILKEEINPSNIFGKWFAGIGFCKLLGLY